MQDEDGPRIQFTLDESKIYTLREKDGVLYRIYIVGDGREEWVANDSQQEK